MQATDGRGNPTQWRTMPQTVQAVANAADEHQLKKRGGSLNLSKLF